VEVGVLVAKTPSDIPPLRLEAQAVVALIQILLQQGRQETLQQFHHLKVVMVLIARVLAVVAVVVLVQMVVFLLQQLAVLVVQVLHRLSLVHL
jgi:hypothetical protein